MSCADADCKYPKCECWSIKERNDPRHLKRQLTIAEQRIAKLEQRLLEAWKARAALTEQE